MKAFHDNDNDTLTASPVPARSEGPAQAPVSPRGTGREQRRSPDVGEGRTVPADEPPGLADLPPVPAGPRATRDRRGSRGLPWLVLLVLALVAAVLATCAGRQWFQ